MTTVTPQDKAPEQGMSKMKKVGIGLGIAWIGGIILFVILFGFKPHKAPEVASGVFSPTEEFKLDTWFKLGPINFNKGVLYLLLTVGITLWAMFYISKRMKAKPNRVQVLVEMFYDLTRSMARDNMDDAMTRKYFPLIATLFIFILVTNLIGYIPLPVDSSQKFNLFGAHIPSFQLYAADTNVAFPLILALGVFALFTYEGFRAHGFVGFFKALLPGGLTGFMVGPIFGIECLSYFLRLISLTVRLWANLLAGHMLIAFMSGELGVLTGNQWVEWMLLPIGIAIYLFEAVLIAGLQAFIFAILTAIYLGSSVESH